MTPNEVEYGLLLICDNFMGNRNPQYSGPVQLKLGVTCSEFYNNGPDSEIHGANMGPIWDRQGPGGPHVGPMNFAIWGVYNTDWLSHKLCFLCVGLHGPLQFYDFWAQCLVLLKRHRLNDYRLRFILGIPLTVGRRLLIDSSSDILQSVLFFEDYEK